LILRATITYKQEVAGSSPALPTNSVKTASSEISGSKQTALRQLPNSKAPFGRNRRIIVIAPWDLLRHHCRIERRSLMTKTWKAAGAFLGILLGSMNPCSAQAQPGLKVPADKIIRVLFAVDKETDVMDVAGPWEVFDTVMITADGKPTDDPTNAVFPFKQFIVADTKNPIRLDGGLNVTPDYTFEDAPPANLVVIPAQVTGSEAKLAWIRKMAKSSDVTFSVCMGAHVLADAGLLAGQEATTHHIAEPFFIKKYPNVKWRSGVRYIEGDRVSTAAGVVSGIDLALHIVERYFGRDVAQHTTEQMEYHGDFWKNPNMLNAQSH
jgi:putative intracellular protease/amidase